jgi:phosphomannomutase
VADQNASVERVAEHYGEFPQDRLDGLSADCGDFWFNIRASNTEPLLRLNLEARDKATCEAKTAEVLGLIRS